MRSKPGVWRDAKIHLEVFGQQRALDLRVRSGPARLRDLLPVAAEISAQVTTLAIAHAEAAGKPRPAACRIHPRACSKSCTTPIPLAYIRPTWYCDSGTPIRAAFSVSLKLRLSLALIFTAIWFFPLDG